MGFRNISEAAPTLLAMFHKAIRLDLKEGTSFELTFQDGYVKAYDVSALFDKYPQLQALTDRQLFTAGKLVGGYGIIWNDELDLAAETVYEEGETVRKEEVAPGIVAGKAVLAARAKAGLSQKELAKLSGIDQSDISKIERGVANPSVSSLARIAEALGAELKITIEM